MHTTVAQCTLTDAQNVPKQQSVAPGQLPPRLCLAQCMECPWGQFRPAVPALLPPSSLYYTCLLAEHANWKTFNLEKAGLSNSQNTSLLPTLFSH